MKKGHLNRKKDKNWHGAGMSWLYVWVLQELPSCSCIRDHGLHLPLFLGSFAELGRWLCRPVSALLGNSKPL